MSSKTVGWAFEQQAGSPGAKVVLMAIADEANDDGECYPGQKRLAFKTEMSDRAVRDNLTRLRERGLLRVEERKRANGSRTSNLYILCMGVADSSGGAGSQLPPTPRKPASTPDPTTTSEPTASTATSKATATSTSLDESKGSTAPFFGGLEPFFDPDASGNASERQLPLGEGSDAERPVDPVAVVWATYVEVMKPRKKELLPQERQMIQSALKATSLGECVKAIHGCKASPFHMGENDGGVKYNKLSQILKGKRGGKTIREHIEMMGEFLDKGSRIPSERLAEINRAKEKVRLGLTNPTHDYHREQGEQAQAFLRQFGLEARAVEYEVAAGVMGIRVLWS